jgi:peroxiredoxin
VPGAAPRSRADSGTTSRSWLLPARPWPACLRRTPSTSGKRRSASSLPFPLLSDADLRFAHALRLPVFRAGGQTLLKRLTLIVRDGVVEKVFYPVFPPDRHAEEVLGWLRRENDVSGD